MFFKTVEFRNFATMDGSTPFQDAAVQLFLIMLL